MLLIDTDPGLDDAHALAMALTRLPAEEVIVTTVAGNTGLDAVTRNAAWILGMLAPEVRLYAGAAAPLLGQPVEAVHIHGEDGLMNMKRVPRRPVPVQEVHAAQAIVQAAREHGKDLTIVALGPLTNVALALQLEPKLPQLIDRIVVMGGSPAGFGNASPNAEFNVFADPVAADIVFERMHNVTLITWDLSLQTRFSRDEIESFWVSKNAASDLLRGLHEQRISLDSGYAQSRDFGRADPLAMAVALDSGVIRRSAGHRIRVGYDGGLAHGATVVDWRNETTGRDQLELVLDLDRPALIKALTL
ncbi:Inosine-uridine preferring nucleoside hydrolase [Arthrobacter sp. 9AX]|uniref:nucleoside hydrolase n=1 Tax=Arthrobacter sp. 9AX TaxID=2653131 RepID=UPI0012F10D09|nr:nucleoside hydrolase [Arthrobacter sp. 9AX]VXC19548.1 Inosine-uridine preferring nucleoside hydrolase [Arthrobacter sp. 9AX]